MTRLESFNISLNGSLVVILLGIVVLSVLVYLSYKITIPVISKPLKILLIVLRILALTSILFIVFEPQVSLTYVDKIEPKVAVFIDNSRSISFKDSLERADKIKQLSKSFSDKLGNQLQLNTFGTSLKPLNTDSIDNIKLMEPETNFSNIFNDLKKTDQNYSSVAIISDGIITGGSDPTFTAQKLGISIFTVGVGDSTLQKDIAVKNVLFNQFIYANKPTIIEATIVNNGFGSNNTKAFLYENNVPVQTKDIVLNENGVNKVSFDYTPKETGEKKMRVIVQNLSGEITKENNKYVFYVNVLNDKLKVLIAAGSPSTDVSMFHQSLSLDENLKVKSQVEISPRKFLINPKNAFPNDSADVIILINFPNANSSSEFINQVNNLIRTKNRPFFIAVTQSTSIQRLKQLEQILPFSIGRMSKDVLSTQPEIDESNFGLIFSKDETTSQWDNLPPVLKNSSEFIPKPGSIVLANSKVNNVSLNEPMIIARNIGSQKSIAVLAGDTWKWKLQTADKGLTLFDNFLISSVKWLYNQNKQKQFIVRTSKKNYSLGENVDFTAELYNQTYAPIDNAEVKVSIKNGKQNLETMLDNSGNGIYTGSFSANSAGDYEFSGEADYDNVKLKSDIGKFNIGEVEIEKLNTRMDVYFLHTLARETSGKYYNIANSSNLADELLRINSSYSKDKISVDEIILWSNEWTLFLVILLFAVEWFLRKKAGMV